MTLHSVTASFDTIQASCGNYPVIGTLIVIIIVAASTIKFCRGERKRLPPMAKATCGEILAASATQEGLTQLEFFRDICLNIDKDKHPESTGNTTYGGIARLNIPMACMMYCSDYKLGRLILMGDSANGIREGEKSYIMRLFNFFDARVNSIISHLTSNPDRYAARKCIAKSFSMVNLQQRVPDMEASLAEMLVEIDHCAAAGTSLNVKDVILSLLIRSLSRSAFGVNIVLGGKQKEDEIDGDRYLHLLDIVTREASKRGLNPLRRYKFWSEDVKAYNSAAKELEEMTADLLQLYRKKYPDGYRNGKPDTSILGNIVRHNYKTERERLSDLVLFVIAGHETTAYSLCFLLLDLAKNPECMTRLQTELDKYMPSLPPGQRPPLDAAQISKLCSELYKHEYFNDCIKESMRLWPVAAGGSARDIVEDLTYEGMLIPKGATVFVHYYSTFRSPWIRDYNEFVPDRWLCTDAQAADLKDLLFPFSLGPRACIGQNMATLQMRIIAATILKHYNLSLPEAPSEQPEFEYFITLKTKKLMMNVSHRE